MARKPARPAARALGASAPLLLQLLQPLQLLPAIQATAASPGDTGATPPAASAVGTATPSPFLRTLLAMPALSGYGLPQPEAFKELDEENTRHSAMEASHIFQAPSSLRKLDRGAGQEDTVQHAGPRLEAPAPLRWEQAGGAEQNGTDLNVTNGSLLGSPTARDHKQLCSDGSDGSAGCHAKQLCSDGSDGSAGCAGKQAARQPSPPAPAPLAVLPGPKKVSPATSVLASNASGAASCWVTLSNLSYSALEGDKSVLQPFEAGLKSSFAHEAGEGAKPEDVELTLQPASVAGAQHSVGAFGRVFSDNAEMAQWRLNTTTTAETTIRKSLAQVPGLERNSTEDMQVKGWSAPLGSEGNDALQEWTDRKSNGWLGVSGTSWMWLALMSLLALSCCLVPLFFVLRKKGQQGKGKTTRGAHLDSEDDARAVGGSENEEGSSEEEGPTTQSRAEEVPLMSGRKTQESHSPSPAQVHKSFSPAHQSNSPVHQDQPLDLITVMDGGINIHRLREGGHPPEVPFIPYQ